MLERKVVMIKILFCVLVVYVCVSPLFYAKAVKFGIRLAGEPEKTASEPTFNIPILPKKKPKMTPEQDRQAQILRNIDNYNGTSLGQQKVRVKK